MEKLYINTQCIRYEMCRLYELDFVWNLNYALFHLFIKHFVFNIILLLGIIKNIELWFLVMYEKLI